jgi:hypothetical protein
VNVGAQAQVVGEIPAVVVRVLVNHHVVAVPIPAIAIREVKWGDAEIEAAKRETAGIATLYAPPMSMTQATLKVAVFPGMIEAETLVIPPPIVANPFAVAVHVWGFGMIVAVPIGAPILVLVAIVFVLVTMISRGAMARNISSTNVVVPVVCVVVVVLLGECRQRQDHRGREDSGEQFHSG